MILWDLRLGDYQISVRRFKPFSVQARYNLGLQCVCQTALSKHQVHTMQSNNDGNLSLLVEIFQAKSIGQNLKNAPHGKVWWKKIVIPITCKSTEHCILPFHKFKCINATIHTDILVFLYRERIVLTERSEPWDQTLEKCCSCNTAHIHVWYIQAGNAIHNNSTSDKCFSRLIISSYKLYEAYICQHRLWEDNLYLLREDLLNSFCMTMGKGIM